MGCPQYSHARRDSTTVVCGSRVLTETEKGAVTPAEEGAVLSIAIKHYSGVKLASCHQPL